MSPRRVTELRVWRLQYEDVPVLELLMESREGWCLKRTADYHIYHSFLLSLPYLSWYLRVRVIYDIFIYFYLSPWYPNESLRKFLVAVFVAAASLTPHFQIFFLSTFAAVTQPPSGHCGNWCTVLLTNVTLLRDNVSLSKYLTQLNESSFGLSWTQCYRGAWDLFLSPPFVSPVVQ